MRPELKSLNSPDTGEGPLETWAPPQPDRFAILVSALVGLPGQDGGDSFDFMVCSPLGLAGRPREKGYELIRAMLLDYWDFGVVQRAITDLCRRSDGEDWDEVALKLTRFATWEFEDYQKRRDLISRPEDPFCGSRQYGHFMERRQPRLVWHPAAPDEAAFAPLSKDHVLRLYGEVFAGSPLWTPWGQVEPDELQLSAELARDVMRWAHYYEAHASNELNGRLLKDGEDEARFGTAWATLAARLATELGSDFGVEKGDLGPLGFAIVRSSQGPSRPEAAAAFGALIATGRESDRLPPSGLSFYAP